MFKNLLLLVIFLFQTFLLTTSLSCTKSEESDNPKAPVLQQSNETKNTELNKLKQEVTNQQAEITSKSLQVSALEKTKKDLSFKIGP